MGNTIHETRRKKWRSYAGTSSHQNYANSAFLLLYSSIPILPFLLYPTIISNFHTCEKIRWSAYHRCIFICIYLFFNFRVYQRSSVFWFWPLLRKFHEKSPNSRRWRGEVQRWWRARKQEIAWASCMRVIFISRIFIHTFRKGNFATQDWREAGATKWRAFF